MGHRFKVGDTVRVKTVRTEVSQYNRYIAKVLKLDFGNSTKFPIYHLMGERVDNEFFYEDDLELLNTGGVNVREYLKQHIETLRKYDQYLIILAVLISLDHFLLKGAMRDKIVRLVTTLCQRLMQILESGIQKIGGTDGTK
jgi:hypothetical protein